MFIKSCRLPEYLEEALEPFKWSSIFSTKFRDDIVTVVLAHNRQDVIPSFVNTLNRIQFLDEQFVDQLSSALLRFAKEGFPK